MKNNMKSFIQKLLFAFGSVVCLTPEATYYPYGRQNRRPKTWEGSYDWI